MIIMGMAGNCSERGEGCRWEWLVGYNDGDDDEDEEEEGDADDKVVGGGQGKKGENEHLEQVEPNFLRMGHKLTLFAQKLKLKLSFGPKASLDLGPSIGFQDCGCKFWNLFKIQGV